VWEAAMAGSSLRRFLDQLHERQRDQFLTALTLLLLLEMFVVMPLRAVYTIETHVVGGTIVLVMTAGLLVLARSAVPMIGVLVAAAFLVTATLVHASGGQTILYVCLEALAWLVIGLVITWVVARAVFAAGDINYHRVVGAVLLYLAMGFVFVALYTLVGVLNPGAFSGLTVTDRATLPSELIYFSFVTLTTVGYGDIAPVHPLARSLCNLEAILGQLYPATLLARMVTLELQSRR
jgi:hypothetical protein